jgi:hypothetical protein
VQEQVESGVSIQRNGNPDAKPIQIAPKASDLEELSDLNLLFSSSVLQACPTPLPTAWQLYARGGGCLLLTVLHNSHAQMQWSILPWRSSSKARREDCRQLPPKALAVFW